MFMRRKEVVTLMKTVRTIDWMLNHKGVAIAKAASSDNTVVEIIKYSEKPEEYPELKATAKADGLVFVVGRGAEEENRLGYFV